MASNQFGNLFRITTWGESHGKAIGVVIDGCPAGVPIKSEEINHELKRRRPGVSPYVSPRNEEDNAEILSGVFEGKTTGAPISIVIYNKDADSTKYDPIKNLLRPGHANYTYLEKYGLHDYRGGGRASARETACRVAAGALAKKMLKELGIEISASLVEIGGIGALTEEKIIEAITKAKNEGDSLGGVIEMCATGLPVGLGDPVYEKIDAKLGSAFLSLPACKGVEIGSGFAGARMKGSEHNDLFEIDENGKVVTKTNHAGGLLGGITNGMPLIVRCAFKPTSSILKPQQTLNLDKEKEAFRLPEGSRHDPCVAIRAIPVVEAMGALVLIDAWLMNQTARVPLKVETDSSNETTIV